MVHSRTATNRRAAAFALLFPAATLLLGTGGQRAAAAEVATVSGEAFGYSAEVGFFSNPPESDGPTPIVTLPAGGSSLLSETEESTFVQFGPAVILESGEVTVTTEGSTGAAGAVAGTTSMAEIVAGGFTADLATSACTATETGVTATTTIENGEVFSAEDPEDDEDDTVTEVPLNPAPNTSYEGTAAGIGDEFEIVVNEQIINEDGSITVNAVHVNFLGPLAVGELIIGQATCGAVAADVPPVDNGTQYVMVAKDGGVFAPGGQGFNGTAAVRPGEGIKRDSQGRIIGASGSPLDSPVVAFAYTPSREGYWLAQANGGVIPIGDAGDVGDLLDLDLNAPIVGAAATDDGEGLYLVASDGGVFALGTAPFKGSLGGARLNEPIVGMSVDGDGEGYLLAAADGGVFAYDATFLGSLGSSVLNKPIVGIDVAPDGGYVLAASDGGVFAYGVEFAGSLGSLTLQQPVVGIALDPDGGGYWMAGADGGVFAFDAPFRGSVANLVLNAPISGIAAFGSDLGDVGRRP